MDQKEKGRRVSVAVAVETFMSVRLLESPCKCLDVLSLSGFPLPLPPRPSHYPTFSSSFAEAAE